MAQQVGGDGQLSRLLLADPAGSGHAALRRLATHARWAVRPGQQRRAGADALARRAAAGCLASTRQPARSPTLQRSRTAYPCVDVKVCKLRSSQHPLGSVVAASQARLACRTIRSGVAERTVNEAAAAVRRAPPCAGALRAQQRATAAARGLPCRGPPRRGSARQQQVGARACARRRRGAERRWCCPLYRTAA